MNIKCSYTELVDPYKLVPNPRNNNKHDEKQIKWLSKIIDFQGQRRPIIVSKTSGFINCGHATLEALKKLKYEKVAVDYQEFENEAEEYANMTADNEIARYAELDLSQVHLDLSEIEFDLDTDLLGLKLDSIEEVEGLTDEDEVPEVEDSITKKGDVWLLGNHRLMCGDSTMIDDVEKLMDGQKADMVFTDPPYGYKYESNHQDKHEMLKNDDKILDFLPMSNTILKKSGVIYLCTSHQVIDKWKPLVEDSFNYKNLIVWKKNNWSMGDLKGSFAGQHELIIFATKFKSKMIGSRDTDVWEFDREPPGLHPTMKPIELIEYALSKWESRITVDLFLGSGSTLIACEKTNRKCYGMELDEHYCDVIINRWQNFTGKEAVLENSDGKTYNGIKGITNGRCL